jgi:hypothetical protein
VTMIFGSHTIDLAPSVLSYDIQPEPSNPLLLDYKDYSTQNVFHGTFPARQFRPAAFFTRSDV